MSVSRGIVQGIETGVRIADTFEARRRQRELDEERRQERSEQRERQRRLDLTAEEDRRRRIEAEDAARQRQQEQDALAALASEEEALRREATGMAERYGAPDKVPEAERAEWTRRYRETSRRRQEINERRYRPIVERATQRAQQIIQQLEAGEIDLADLDDDDLVQVVTVASRRNPRDFLRDGKKPSVVGKAIEDTTKAIETRSFDTLPGTLTQLLKGDLNVGVGGLSESGNQIVGKTIMGLAPAPDGGAGFFPILGVVERTPDGKFMQRPAPLTRNRSGDPDDEVMPPIQIDQAMDYMGRMGMLEQALNAPGVRERLQKALDKDKSSQEFLRAFAAVGARPPKVTTRTTDLGGEVLREQVTDTGIVQGSERLKKTAPPREPAPQRATGIGMTIDQIDAMERRGELTPEEAREARRRTVTGGGQQQARPLSERELSDVRRNAEMSAAAQMGFRWDPERKDFVKDNPDPKAAMKRLRPSADERARIVRAGEDAFQAAQKQARFTGAPGTAAPPPNAPPPHLLKEGVVTTFKNGQKWTLKDGQPSRVE